METKKTETSWVAIDNNYEEVKLDVMLGLAVKRLRGGKNMTQVELAKQAHTTQGWISLVENGKRNKRPSLSTLSRVACALGLSALSELIRFAEKMIDTNKSLEEIEASFSQ